MKKLFVVFFIIANSVINAQQIEGKLSMSIRDSIKLMGFNGFENYNISVAVTDSEGKFKLPYSSSDYGIGYLIAGDRKPFFIVLNEENTEINGELLSISETVKILKGKENKLFEQYASEHPKREQALSAWDYLAKIYQNEDLFSSLKNQNDAIKNEIKRIKKEDVDFLNNLDKNSYISWYLPLRKLVSSVATIAQYRTDEIRETIHAFRKIDYTNPKLYKSGLLKDVIESHFWLIENSGNTLDTVFMEMSISIDSMMNYLTKNETKLNEITEYVFNLLEKHSLFKASEYLALKVLNDDECGCSVNTSLSNQLEQYRMMKTGNTAPDFKFTGDVIKQDSDELYPKKLSELESEYTVIVFGSSWCSTCTEEIPQIAKLYPKWKKQNVEVVFISLDDNKENFHNFASNFPFISMCDYKKWKNDIVESYYIFATPTMYLLDKNREILLKPRSVKQMDAWVNWFLIEGNPRK